MKPEPHSLPSPSPWHSLRAGERYAIRDKADQLVAVAQPQVKRGMAKANSDLIAAAPDLLGACKIALEVIRRHDIGETGCGMSADQGLAPYCGEQCLTDPDGVDGIEDVLVKTIAKAEPTS